MNDFSMVCRVLGTLFYRNPQDPVLAPLMTLILEGKLTAHWPLKQDELLARWQQCSDAQSLSDEYQTLLSAQEPRVSPFRSSWTGESNDVLAGFLQQIGFPVSDGAADHFGSLLLAASWLEDHAQEDETLAQRELFDLYLLPWSDRFLGKVESSTGEEFYRVLAIITREALQAMREELEEEAQ